MTRGAERALGITPGRTWPVTDLRIDWHDDPIAELARLWAVWRPQEAAYLQRALDPTTAPGYPVGWTR